MTRPHPSGPDLLLAQVQRRLDQAGHAERQAEADEMVSELIVSWIVLGIVATFCLLLWVL